MLAVTSPGGAILLGADVVLFKDPINGKHAYRWWAENGLIRWENVDTGEYGTNTVTDQLHFLQGFNTMIGNSRTAKGYMMPDEVKIYQDFVSKMVELCKRADQQGRPDNPRHVKQRVAEMRAKRQSRNVIMPGRSGAAF